MLIRISLTARNLRKQAGESTALIGVHDLRLAVFIDGLFECIKAKTGVYGNQGPFAIMRGGNTNPSPQ